MSHCYSCLYIPITCLFSFLKRLYDDDDDDDEDGDEEANADANADADADADADAWNR